MPTLWIDEKGPIPKLNVLVEADKTINGARQDSYGKPEDSFQRIADYWSDYLTHQIGEYIEIHSIDVAHMMALFKIARMCGHAPHRDNYVDACGYLAIAGDRLLEVPDGPQ